jgi:FtsZ-binding cell division protein ZapB
MKQHPPHSVRVAFVAVGLGLFFSGRVEGQDTVSDFRIKMEKWVETRQILSQETSEWEVERETLEASRDLLRQQKKALEAEIAELKETSTVADDERLDLLLKRGEYQRANRSLEDQIRALEEEAQALAPQLPEPLRERLELLLVQIPDDPETTRVPLGQRLMNVLGGLAQAEKFNGTATFVGETRAVDGDQKIQLRTLYWGLGQAIYVDSKGEIAGIGHPGAEGWEFSNEPDLADQAKLLLDIYEGNVDVIRFVRLPVEIR